MSKELEEVALIVIVGVVLLKVLGSSTASATQLAQIQSNTNLGYANDAASVALGIFGD